MVKASQFGFYTIGTSAKIWMVPSCLNTEQFGFWHFTVILNGIRRLASSRLVKPMKVFIASQLVFFVNCFQRGLSSIPADAQEFLRAIKNVHNVLLWFFKKCYWNQQTIYSGMLKSERVRISDRKHRLKSEQLIV